MKWSRMSKLDHLLGFAVFLLSAVTSALIAYIEQNQSLTFAVLAFGMASMAVCWIIGIERDLYNEEKVKA